MPASSKPPCRLQSRGPSRLSLASWFAGIATRERMPTASRMTSTIVIRRRIISAAEWSSTAIKGSCSPIIMSSDGEAESWFGCQVSVPRTARAKPMPVFTPPMLVAIWRS